MKLPEGREPLDDEWFLKYARTVPGVKTSWDFPTVNRVEVIDNIRGRRYVQHNCTLVGASFQDDGKTLKIFVEYQPEEEISND